jgi:hypothetical protein
VQQRLALWQREQALTGVRGAGIPELPEAEREAWQKLWSDVDALKARAAGPVKTPGEARPGAKGGPSDKP